MPDIIEKIGQSIIQHGPHNRRVYLMKLHNQDALGILPDLECLARHKKYGKILAKIPSAEKAVFKAHGYAQEAVIPKYFKNGEDAVFMCKYFSPSRKHMTEKKQIQEILYLTTQRKHRLATGNNKRSLTSYRCRPDDTGEMSRVFKTVFETYPFPIFDAEYLTEVIKKKQAQYFCIRENERIVAIAAAEIDFKHQAVEMTDFATLPEFRSQGLAGCILKDMEQSMTKQGMKTAFSIARALSFAMNVLFAQEGYSFGGTLFNNTHIAGRIESMNVWHKRL